MKLEHGTVIHSIPPLNASEEQKKKLAEYVGALRSGKYKRTVGCLRSGDCFCVLGVACDLVAPGNWKESKDGGGDRYDFLDPKSSDKYGSSYQLTTSVRDAFGMPSLCGVVVFATYTNNKREETGSIDMAILNDKGATFDELALIIEYAMNNGYKEGVSK